MFFVFSILSITAIAYSQEYPSDPWWHFTEEYSLLYSNQYFNASHSPHRRWWFNGRKAEVMQWFNWGIKPHCSAWTQLACIIKIPRSQGSSHSIKPHSEGSDACDCSLNSLWGYQALQDSPLSEGVFFPTWPITWSLSTQCFLRGIHYIYIYIYICIGGVEKKLPWQARMNILPYN